MDRDTYSDLHLSLWHHIHELLRLYIYIHTHIYAYIHIYIYTYSHTHILYTYYIYTYIDGQGYIFGPARVPLASSP